MNGATVPHSDMRKSSQATEHAKYMRRAAACIIAMTTYRLQLEVHELGTVVGVQQHPGGRQLLILGGDLREVQELHAHCHVLHDRHHHLSVQLHCFVVYKAAQGAPLRAYHYLRANVQQCMGDVPEGAGVMDADP